MSSPELPDQPCREFVELVTDYLEDALSTQERARVDQHLEICAGCRTVLAQWHAVIRLTGRLADTEVETEVNDLDPPTRQQLLASFRHRHDR